MALAMSIQRCILCLSIDTTLCSCKNRVYKQDHQTLFVYRKDKFNFKVIDIANYKIERKINEKNFNINSLIDVD